MEHIYQREALLSLRRWRERPDRKPLVLRGARQVGKTTLVNEFAREFDTYVRLNLEIWEHAAMFDTVQDARTLLQKILFLTNTRQQGTLLLFIDEIQHSSVAVAMLRYFYEQTPEVYVIAAGSILQNLEKQKVTFPVGRVEYMALRPFSFCEFLHAMSEHQLADAIQAGLLPAGVHQKAMSLFNTYTLTGGMPAAVRTYVETRDLVAIESVYSGLLTSYRDDVEKYAATQTMTSVIRHILSYGLPYAAQSITLNNFAGSVYKSREVGEAFRQLEKAMLVHLVYPSVTTVIPAPPSMTRAPRLYWLDTGLVNYAAGLRKEIFGAKDILDVYRGKIAEQIVAQELLATDGRYDFHLRFWEREKKGSSAEVDFVYQMDAQLLPIEVKSGTNAKLKSLHIYMDSCPHDLAVRVWSGPLSVDEVKTSGGKTFRLLNLPFYYVGQLPKMVEKTAPPQWEGR